VEFAPAELADSNQGRSVGPNTEARTSSRWKSASNGWSRSGVRSAGATGARVPAPAIERPHWGQQRALAHYDHRITLPKWARNEWVILHEAAHRLTPRRQEPALDAVMLALPAA